eukprot:1462291-Prymnesium_polylepis.1
MARIMVGTVGVKGGWHSDTQSDLFTRQCVRTEISTAAPYPGRFPPVRGVRAPGRVVWVSGVLGRA